MKALMQLNPYLWKYKGHLLLGFIFIVANNFLSIYSLNFFQDAFTVIEEHAQDLIKNITDISEWQKNQYFRSVGKSILIFVILQLSSGLFMFFQRQTMIVASRKIEYDVRNTIFQHFQELPYSFYSKNRIGDMMNRITEDLSNVRMYLGPGIMYMVNLLSLFVIIITFMLKTDSILTLYTVLPLPILSILIYLVSKTISKRSKVLQKNQSALSSFAQDTFSGIRVVKAYNREEYISSKYSTYNQSYRKSALRMAFVEAYFFPLMILIIGITNVLLLFIGGMRVESGIISVSVVLVFFMYLNKLIWPFTSLGWVTSLTQKAEVSMKRILEMLDEEIEDKVLSGVSNEVTGKLEFKNVFFTYENSGIIAMNNVSFSIEPGETVLIMGRTGSGKSTLVKLITKTLLPNQGDILLDDISITEWNTEKLRDAIGFVPQEAFLFSDSIAANIAFGKTEVEPHEIELYSKRADLHDNIIDFTEGYQTKVGERGVTLSGGQKQRASIARALIKQPEILIFDDSLSAVDTETEEKILSQIQQESEGKTTIIISHRISALKFADKLIYLEDGEIKEYGNPVELLQKKSYLKDIYLKQIAEKELFF